MSERKYIIKNCDCILSSGRCNVKSLVFCQDCTDCVLKQIVDRCKVYRNMEAVTTEDYARREVALKILDLLDIQEAK